MSFVKVVARACVGCGHDSAALICKQVKPGYPAAWRIVCGNSGCGAIGSWSGTDAGAVMRWNDERGAA